MSFNTNLLHTNTRKPIKRYTSKFHYKTNMKKVSDTKRVYHNRLPERLMELTF